MGLIRDEGLRNPNIENDGKILIKYCAGLRARSRSVNQGGGGITNVEVIKRVNVCVYRVISHLDSENGRLTVRCPDVGLFPYMKTPIGCRSNKKDK